MPLASARDKETEIVWGIKDFVHRFQRYPEGMWLAETAVDYQTLELLAKHGIRYTILSPHQALRVQTPHGEWLNVEGGNISTTQPYLVDLPHHKTISIFFYHADLSRAVAFGGLLNDGRYFANRLIEGFDQSKSANQLVHIATDGESYGHHHRFGEMALAFALDVIDHRSDVRLTNYGEYLSFNPPTWKVEIIENTSWSCAHGIERWRSDCGCQSGQHPTWNQQWRVVLREAIDYVRNTTTPLIEALTPKWLKDPWKAREDYVEVILRRTRDSFDDFILRHEIRPLDLDDTTRVLQLMELSRHLLLMYTSCGWFFDDVGGIEAVQVMRYAARAIQLAEQLFDVPMEQAFLRILESAKSNQNARDGRVIFNSMVKSRMVDLSRVALHYSMMRLLTPGEQDQTASIYGYDARADNEVLWRSGAVRMAVGQVQITSQMTWERATFNYAVLHLGDHNVMAGVRNYHGPELYDNMVKQLERAFHAAEFPEVIRLLDQFFPGQTNSLRHLFPDEQERVIRQLVGNVVEEALTYNHHIYEQSASFMRFMKDLGQSIPLMLRDAAATSIQDQFHRQLINTSVDFEEIRRLLSEAREWDLLDNWRDFSYDYEMFIKRLAVSIDQRPQDLSRLHVLIQAVQMAHNENLRVNLQDAQLAVFGLTATADFENDDLKRQWEQSVGQLDDLLQIHRHHQ